MPKTKKTNQLIRYLKLYKKQLKRLTWEKFLFWVNKNLESHPFILGFAVLSWLSYIIGSFFENKTLLQSLKSHLKYHGILIGGWFALVIFANLLRDKEKVKWFLKKRFVFATMVLLPPLGVILMWAGAKFKRITKIILTIVFSAYFIGFSVRHEIKYQEIINKKPFERVTEMIGEKKEKTFIKAYEYSKLPGVRLEGIPEKERVKLAVSDIYSRYANSIAVITPKDKNGKEIGIGSGFLVSKDGFIVTNAHVIESAHKAEVKIGDKIFNEVYLVKNAPDLDIAVLKINAKDLVSLVLGDSDATASGEFVVVLGNPMGFESSVSSGIVSAMRSGSKIKLIQITAPVSPGSSGGPVFNEYGEVIGITTIASYFAQNLNFAVPINYFKKIVEEK